MPFRTIHHRERPKPQVLFCDGEGVVHVRDVARRMVRTRDRVMASSWPTGR